MSFILFRLVVWFTCLPNGHASYFLDCKAADHPCGAFPDGFRRPENTPVEEHIEGLTRLLARRGQSKQLKQMKKCDNKMT